MVETKYLANKFIELTVPINTAHHGRTDMAAVAAGGCWSHLVRIQEADESLYFATLLSSLLIIKGYYIYLFACMFISQSSWNSRI